MEYESTEAKKLVNLLETSELQEKAYWLSRTRRAIAIWSIVFVLLALTVTFVILGLNERSRYVNFGLHYVKYDDDENRSDIGGGVEDRRATIYDTVNNITPPDDVQGYDFTGNYYNSSNYEVVVDPDSNIKESLTYEESLFMQYELGHYKLTIESSVGSSERFETPAESIGYNKPMYIAPSVLMSSKTNGFINNWKTYNDTKTITYVGNNFLNLYALSNATVVKDSSNSEGYRVQDYDGKTNYHIWGFSTVINGKVIKYVISEAYYIFDGENIKESQNIKSTYLVEKLVNGVTVAKNFSNGYIPVFVKDKQGNDTWVVASELQDGKYIYRAAMSNDKPKQVELDNENENANLFRMPGKDTIVNIEWEADDRYVVIVDTIDDYSKDIIFANQNNNNETIKRDYSLIYDTVEGYINSAIENGENNDWTTLHDIYDSYGIDWSKAVVIPKDIGQDNVTTLVNAYVKDSNGEVAKKSSSSEYYYPVAKFGFKRTGWQIYGKGVDGTWGWQNVNYNTNINSSTNKEVCILIRPVWVAETYNLTYASSNKLISANGLDKYPGYGSRLGQYYLNITTSKINENSNRYLINSNAGNINLVPVIAKGGYSFVGWQLPNGYDLKYNYSVGNNTKGYADIVSGSSRNIIIEQPTIVKNFDENFVNSNSTYNYSKFKVVSKSIARENANLFVYTCDIQEESALVTYNFYYFGSLEDLENDKQVITKIPYGYYLKYSDPNKASDRVSSITLTDVWEIIDYSIRLDYNITTPLLDAEGNQILDSNGEIVYTLSKSELVLDDGNLGLNVVYGIRGFAKTEDLIKTSVDGKDVETGFKIIYNIGNSVTLPNNIQLYRRGYTLVGYSYNVIENGELVTKTIDVGNNPVIINGGNGSSVNDLYGDTIFKAIWKQNDYSVTTDKPIVDNNMTFQYGETNLGYDKQEEVKITKPTYVALLNGNEFSFLDQSSGRTITFNPTIKPNFNYAFASNNSTIAYVRLNDYYSDSTFALNIVFSDIDCGTYMEQKTITISSVDIFGNLKSSDKQNLNYEHEFKIDVTANGVTTELTYAKINISIVTYSGEEYYLIKFDNLACSVTFSLSEINYNLVENFVLPNPSYYTNENSRIENIENDNFVPDEWYVLNSGSINSNIEKVLNYNKYHANKIRFVISLALSDDGLNYIYRFFDTNKIYLDTETSKYYGNILCTIDYTGGSQITIKDGYLSQLTTLTDMTLVDRNKLASALLVGNGKVSGNYTNHTDYNATIRNTDTSYLSLQSITYTSILTFNNQGSYYGIYSNEIVDYDYLKMAPGQVSIYKTNDSSIIQPIYSAKYTAWSKENNIYAFNNLPSNYSKIELFAKKNGDEKVVDNDLTFTILNEIANKVEINKIVDAVGSKTLNNNENKLLSTIVRSATAYNVVDGKLELITGEINNKDNGSSKLLSFYVPSSSSIIIKPEFSGKYDQFNSKTDEEKITAIEGMFVGIQFSGQINAYTIVVDGVVYIIFNLAETIKSTESLGTVGENNERIHNAIEIYINNPQTILNSFDVTFEKNIVNYGITNNVVTTESGWGNIKVGGGNFKNNDIFSIRAENAVASGLYHDYNYSFVLTLGADYKNSPIELSVGIDGVEGIVKVKQGDTNIKINENLAIIVSFAKKSGSDTEYLITLSNIDCNVSIGFNNVYRNIYNLVVNYTGNMGTKDIASELFNTSGYTQYANNDNKGTYLFNANWSKIITIDNSGENAVETYTETGGIKTDLSAFEILRNYLNKNYGTIVTDEFFTQNCAIKFTYTNSVGTEINSYFITQDVNNSANNLNITMTENTEAISGGVQVKYTIEGNESINDLKINAKIESENLTIDNYSCRKASYTLTKITGNVTINITAKFKEVATTINTTGDNPNEYLFKDGNNSQAWIIGAHNFENISKEDSSRSLTNLNEWFNLLVNSATNIRSCGYNVSGSELTEVPYGSFLLLQLQADDGYERVFNTTLTDGKGSSILSITYNKSNSTRFTIESNTNAIVYQGYDSENDKFFVAVMLKNITTSDSDTTCDFTLTMTNPINLYSVKDESSDKNNYTITGLIDEVVHGTGATVTYTLNTGYTDSDYTLEIWLTEVGGSQTNIYTLNKNDVAVTNHNANGIIVTTEKLTNGVKITFSNIIGDIAIKSTTELTLNTLQLTIDNSSQIDYSGGSDVKAIDLVGLSGVNENLTSGIYQYGFTYGNSLTLTLRPKTKYLKSGYLLTINGTKVTFDTQDYTFDTKDYVNAVRGTRTREISGLSITIEERWYAETAGEDEYLEITVTIEEVTTALNFSITGMSTNTYKVNYATGQSTAYPNLSITGATLIDKDADNNNLPNDKKYYVVGENFVNNTTENTLDISAMILTSYDAGKTIFTIKTIRYNGVKNETKFEGIANLETAISTYGSYTDETQNNIKLVVTKFEDVENSKEYYKYTFSFSGVNYDINISCEIDLAEYIVEFNSDIALSDAITIEYAITQIADIEGNLSDTRNIINNSTELDKLINGNGEFSIDSGSNLRVVFRLSNPKYYIIISELIDALGINNDNVITDVTDYSATSFKALPGTYLYHQSDKSNIFGNSSNTITSNLFVIEFVKITSAKDINLPIKEKSYTMTIDGLDDEDNTFVKEVKNHENAIIDKELDQTDNNYKYKITTLYSNLSSSNVISTIKLNASYTKTKLTFYITFTNIETGEKTPYPDNNQSVTVENGSECVIDNKCRITINTDGLITITQFRNEFYDINIVFNEPNINVYSLSFAGLDMKDEFGSDLRYEIETTVTGYKVTYYKDELFSGYNGGSWAVSGTDSNGKFSTTIGTIEINLNGHTLYSNESATTAITSLDLVNAMYYTYNESNSINVIFTNARTYSNEYGFKTLVMDTSLENYTISIKNQDSVVTEECVYARGPFAMSVYGTDKVSHTDGSNIIDYSNKIGGLSLYGNSEEIASNLLSEWIGASSIGHAYIVNFLCYVKATYNLANKYFDVLTTGIDEDSDGNVDYYIIKSDFISITSSDFGSYRLRADSKDTSNDYTKFVVEMTNNTNLSITVNEDKLKVATYDYMLDYIAHGNDVSGLGLCDNAKYLTYTDFVEPTYTSNTLTVGATIRYSYADIDVVLATIVIKFSGDDITNTSSVTGSAGRLLTIDDFGTCIKVPYMTQIVVTIELNKDTASINRNGNNWSSECYLELNPNGSWCDFWVNSDNNNPTIAYRIDAEKLTGDYNLTTRDFVLNLHRNRYIVTPNDSLTYVATTRMMSSDKCRHVDNEYREHGDNLILYVKDKNLISNMNYKIYNDNTSGYADDFIKINGENAGNLIGTTLDPLTGSLIITENHIDDRYRLQFNLGDTYDNTLNLIIKSSLGNSVTINFYDSIDRVANIIETITIDSANPKTIKIDTSKCVYFDITRSDTYTSELDGLTFTLNQIILPKYSKSMGNKGESSNISKDSSALVISNISTDTDPSSEKYLYTTMNVDVTNNNGTNYIAIFDVTFNVANFAVNQYSMNINTTNLTPTSGVEYISDNNYKLTANHGESKKVEFEIANNYSSSKSFYFSNKVIDENSFKDCYIIEKLEGKNSSSTDEEGNSIVWGYFSHINSEGNKTILAEFKGHLVYEPGTNNFKSMILDFRDYSIFIKGLSLYSDVNTPMYINFVLNNDCDNKTLYIGTYEINKISMKISENNTDSSLDNVSAMFSDVNIKYNGSESANTFTFGNEYKNIEVDKDITITFELNNGFVNLDHFKINDTVYYFGNTTYTIDNASYSLSHNGSTVTLIITNITGSIDITMGQCYRDTYNYSFGWETGDSGMTSDITIDGEYSENDTIVPGNSTTTGYYDTVITASFTINNKYSDKINNLSVTIAGSTYTLIMYNAGNDYSDWLSTFDAINGAVWEYRYIANERKWKIKWQLKADTTFSLTLDYNTTDFTLNYIDDDYVTKSQTITLTYGQTISEAISNAVLSIPNVTGLELYGFTPFGMNTIKDSNTNSEVGYSIYNMIYYNGIYYGDYSSFDFSDTTQYTFSMSGLVSGNLVVWSPDLAITGELFDMLAGGVGVVYNCVSTTVNVDYSNTSGETDTRTTQLTYTLIDYDQIMYLTDEINSTGFTGHSGCLGSDDSHPFQQVVGFKDINNTSESDTWSLAKFNDTYYAFMYNYTSSETDESMKRVGMVLNLFNTLAQSKNVNEEITIYAQYAYANISVNFVDETNKISVENVIDGVAQNVKVNGADDVVSSVYATTAIGQYTYYLFMTDSSDSTKYILYMGNSNNIVDESNSVTVNSNVQSLDYFKCRLLTGNYSDYTISDYNISINGQDILWSAYSGTSTNTLQDMLSDYWYAYADKGFVDSEGNAISGYAISIEVVTAKGVSLILVMPINGDSSHAYSTTLYSGTYNLFDGVRSYINDESNTYSDIIASYYMVPNANGIGYINGFANTSSTFDILYYYDSSGNMIYGSSSDWLSDSALNVDNLLNADVSQVIIYLVTPRGNVDNPFIINNANAWNTILINNSQSTSNMYYYRQTLDLNLNELDRAQQGDYFAGYYDGNQNETGNVSSSTLNRNGDVNPLFENIKDGSSISNLKLVGNVTNPKNKSDSTDNWGNIASYVDSTVSFNNIITGNSGDTINVSDSCAFKYIGALFGQGGDQISINSCSNNYNMSVTTTSTSSSNTYVAGIAGYLSFSTIANTQNNGDITVTAGNTDDKIYVSGISNIILSNASASISISNTENNGNILSTVNTGQINASGIAIITGGSDITGGINISGCNNAGSITSNKYASGVLLIADNRTSSYNGAISSTIRIETTGNSGDVTATYLASGVIASEYDQAMIIGDNYSDTNYINASSLVTENRTTKNSGAINGNYASGIYAVLKAQNAMSGSTITSNISKQISKIANAYNTGSITGQYVSGITEGIWGTFAWQNINSGNINATDGVASGLHIVRSMYHSNGEANNVSITVNGSGSFNGELVATGIVAVCALDGSKISYTRSDGTAITNNKTLVSITSASNNGSQGGSISGSPNSNIFKSFASGICYVNTTNTNTSNTNAIYLSECVNSQNISGDYVAGILTINNDSVGNSYSMTGVSSTSTSILGSVLVGGLVVYNNESTLATISLSGSCSNSANLTLNSLTDENGYIAGLVCALGGYVSVSGSQTNSGNITLNGDKVLLGAGLVIAKLVNITSGTNNGNIQSNVTYTLNSADANGDQEITQGAIISGGVIAYGSDNASSKTIRISGLTIGGSITSSSEETKAVIGVNYAIVNMNYTIGTNSTTGGTITALKSADTCNLSSLPEDWYLSITI